MIQDKIKILIIPSWYPTEKDKINGSFFRDQAKILLDKYDIRVLYIEFINHPKKKLTFRSAVNYYMSFLKRNILGNEKTKLPDEEIFLLPPLDHYLYYIFAPTRKSYYNITVKLYLNRIKQLINNGWRPDLIHAHSANIAGIVSLNAKQQLNIPYVITEHRPFSICAYPLCIQRKIRESFLKADSVLSVSYDKVRQLGMSEINIEPKIVYNYVDENIFNKIIPCYESGSPLKIISIGAASYLKDHITLLKALRIIHSEKIPFILTLVGLKTWGQNETYDSIIQFIKDNNLRPNIRIIDTVTRDEISNYLLENNVFLITSIAEGLSVSMLEAMATGLTVIATRHGGAEDILTPGTGILVKIKDIKEIAVKLKEIYNGKIQFAPEHIRDHVLSICGTQAFSQRISHFYDQAILNNKKDLS